MNSNRYEWKCCPGVEGITESIKILTSSCPTGGDSQRLRQFIRHAKNNAALYKEGGLPAVSG